MTESLPHSEPALAPTAADRPETPFRRSATPLLVALAAGAALFLAWQTAGTLLLIFAGLLFGSLLDAATRGLAYVLPGVGRGWRLALVCALLAGGTAWLLAWGGYNLVAQADGLIDLIAEQLRTLRGELRNMGVAPPPSQGPDGQQRTLAQLLLPDPSTLFGTAYSAVSLASGLLGNAVVVVFVGLFAAADPPTYRRGVLALLPRRHRRRAGEVLDEMVATLRWWLVGQLVAVVLIALSTWLALALIGMPGAFLLGLQAGLLNFIPYLGPVIAAVPVGLAAMAQGTSTLLWAMGVYAVIQSVEGYVLAPLIQKRAVDLPPVLTLAAVALFGTLFGAMGVALATPLVAVLKVAVTRLYVEDRLGGA